MKRLILLQLFLLTSITLLAENQKLYLIAGHGSDIRIFSKIIFPENIDTVHLHYLKPKENETMNEYAFRLSRKIDTTQKFSIMGVSLGGMLACEMTTFLNPEKVIIISSAAGENELPMRYKWMRNFEFYRVFAGWFYKGMTKTAQLLFEPDRMKAGDEFDAMIKDKDPDFIKRGIHMVVNWEQNYSSSNNLYHIHGEKDHTLPIKNSNPDYIVKDGSHMMALTKADEISKIVAQIFCDK